MLAKEWVGKKISMDFLKRDMRGLGDLNLIVVFSK